jgi:4-amino-4-deoxy-L-arabinose transferase-like glycosyltransferase
MLQTIDAGRLIRYQHYRSLPILLENSPWLVAYLAAQTALTLIGLRTHWPSIRAWLIGNFKVWQISGIGLVFFLTSATVSREVKVYLMELPFAAFAQTVSLINLLVASFALPGDALARWKERLERFLGGGSEKEIGVCGIDRFALFAAFWVTALASALSFLSYDRHPHIPDEVVYLIHARYFAEGMLFMPAPPVPEAFDIDLMNYEADRWFCPVPPGWPAILAFGALLGVPWLVNPVLAGVNTLLCYVFARELYDRRVARLITLLLCVSPWHVLMAMNFMTHTFTLSCALSAAVATLCARRTGKAGWAFLGGVATGMTSLVRPLEGLVVAGLIGLWILGVGGKRLKFSGIAAFVVGCLIVGVAVVPYNKLLTGSPTKFPIMAYTDKYYGPKTNALGFGPDRGLGWALDPYPGHGLRDVLVNSNLNITSINFELFGWSAGSLLFIALFLFAGRLRGGDYLMIAVIVAVFVAHIFYWFSGGPDFGARYWYLMLVPCVVLTVRGIQLLEDKLEMGWGSSTGQGARGLILALSFCVLTLVNYFPWRAIDKYHHYLRMRPDIRYLAERRDFGRSLVLIRGERHPDYASAAVYNPVDLTAEAPIYAWDRSPEVRAKVLQVYSDRLVWVIEGPSITGGAFKVVEGPLPARELLMREEARRSVTKSQ